MTWGLLIFFYRIMLAAVLNINHHLLSTVYRDFPGSRAELFFVQVTVLGAVCVVVAPGVWLGEPVAADRSELLVHVRLGRVISGCLILFGASLIAVNACWDKILDAVRSTLALWFEMFHLPWSPTLSVLSTHVVVEAELLAAVEARALSGVEDLRLFGRHLELAREQNRAGWNQGWYAEFLLKF